MRLVRSWPATPPAGHAHIIDDVPRVTVVDYDYSALADVGDDMVHLDWDVAVSPEDLMTFAAMARAHPHVPLVAPVWEYPGSLNRGGPRDMDRPALMLRRYTEGGMMRECTPDDRTCHLFGFSMVYLPIASVREFAKECAAEGWMFDDIGFAGWSYNHVATAVPICWDVTPVHLNYPPPALL